MNGLEFFIVILALVYRDDVGRLARAAAERIKARGPAK